MATFTEEQAKVIRDYATNLSADERGNFINRFKSLTDDGQIELANRITKAQTGPKLPAGLTQEMLASKGLPQIIKSAYETVPFGKRIVNALPGGQQLKDIIAATPEPTTLGAKMARFVSKEALPSSAVFPLGFVRGGAVYAGIKAAQENKNIPLEAVKGAAGGFVLGKTLGTVGSAVKGVGQSLKNIPKVLNTNKAADFAEKVTQAFVNVKKRAVDSFSNSLDELAKNNPETRVNIQGVVDNIKNNYDTLTQETKNIINKTPILKDAFRSKDPISLDNLTIKQAQDITNYINTKVPKNIKANNLDLIELVSDIKASQLESFPELAAARESYAKVIQPYNNVKNMFKFNKVLSSIEGNFGGAQGKKAVDSILPKEVIDEIGGYKKAYELLKHARNVAPWVLAGAGTGAGYIGGRIVQSATNPP